MADPAPVLQTFFVDKELQEAYKLDAVITGTGCVFLKPSIKNVVKC
jgi:G3E family GTPase